MSAFATRKAVASATLPRVTLPELSSKAPDATWQAGSHGIYDEEDKTPRKRRRTLNTPRSSNQTAKHEHLETRPSQNITSALPTDIHATSVEDSMTTRETYLSTDPEHDRLVMIYMVTNSVD